MCLFEEKINCSLRGIFLPLRTDPDDKSCLNGFSLAKVWAISLFFPLGFFRKGDLFGVLRKLIPLPFTEKTEGLPCHLRKKPRGKNQVIAKNSYSICPIEFSFGGVM